MEVSMITALANDRYSIKLDIFEGPMDLLVYLVRKHDMDVTDIPIAEITEQYLAYLDLMRFLNIDLAGEFLYMAATLAHIKSRTLLPVHGEEDEEDPRLEIARPLMEYLQLKAAAEHLSGREILGKDTFECGASTSETTENSDEEAEIMIGLFELVEAFRKVMENQYNDHTVDFSTQTMSVKDRIIELVAILEKTPRITFQALLCEYGPNKGMLVLTFLAILEMAKVSLIEIRQHIQSGTIHLCYI